MRRSSVFLFGLPALPRIFFKSETETEFVPVDILIYSEDGKVRPISGRGLGSTPAVQMGSGMEARNRTAPHQIIPDQDTAYQITRDRSAKDGASAETRDRPPSPALARSPRSVESQESSTRTETARTEITRTETAKAEPSETKPKNATANEPKPPNWKTPSSRIKDQLGTASMTAITDKKKSAQVRDNSARDKSQSAMSTLPADPRLEFLLATLVAGDDRLTTAVAPHTTQPRTFHTREVTSAVRVRKTAERHYPHAENNQARRYWRGEGVRHEPETGMRWLSQAAEHGYLPSQIELGYRAAKGVGMKRNLGEAHFWWSIAAARKNLAAQTAREALEPMMTSEEII